MADFDLNPPIPLRGAGAIRKNDAARDAIAAASVDAAQEFEGRRQAAEVLAEDEIVSKIGQSGIKVAQRPAPRTKSVDLESGAGKDLRRLSGFGEIMNSMDTQGRAFLAAALDLDPELFPDPRILERADKQFAFGQQLGLEGSAENLALKQALDEGEFSPLLQLMVERGGYDLELPKIISFAMQQRAVEEMGAFNPRTFQVAETFVDTLPEAMAHQELFTGTDDEGRTIVDLSGLADSLMTNPDAIAPLRSLLDQSLDPATIGADSATELVTVLESRHIRPYRRILNGSTPAFATYDPKTNVLQFQVPGNTPEAKQLGHSLQDLIEQHRRILAIRLGDRIAAEMDIKEVLADLVGAHHMLPFNIQTIGSILEAAPAATLIGEPEGEAAVPTQEEREASREETRRKLSERTKRVEQLGGSSVRP